MTPQPLDVSSTPSTAAGFVHSLGEVFATFDQQDSGNISYGVRVDQDAYFLKTAGPRDDTSHFLTQPERVGLLETVARLHHDIRHPALIPLIQTIACADGPVLVYPWFDGALIGVRSQQRDNPHSAFQRFRALPAENILACLDQLYDLHARLAQAGWIASDLYDGCLMYNFDSGALGVIDLDSYHCGPFVNTMGRMFGSTRFMAPEEFERGAPIDQDTTVFTLARIALVMLGDGSTDASGFRRSRACLDTLAKACNPDRAQRYASVATFVDRWQAARQADWPEIHA